ncbi:single-stranded-DNA-specific exonuclease RecJ [Planifilum fimeticola]
MLRPKTRWRLVEADEQLSGNLAETLGIHPVVARILVSRGIDSPEKAERFLNVDLSQFYDPLLMDEMAPAVERIRFALEKGEKILVYGDYDADGVSSTGLMMGLFRGLEADVRYYIPNRFREGYGLNREALHHAREAGTDLIVTVDTGISALEEAEEARKLGLDLIITDHHEPPSALPEALAVINPKKPTCPYPFKGLAGVGVAFKLAHALLGRVPEEFLEVAALGTIADLVPLLDENRVIASLGLERMNRRRHLGLTALMDVAGIKGDVKSGHVGFFLGPRINATGRLDSADRAVRLLLTEDPIEAQSIAEELDRMNRERQKLVEAIYSEAEAQVRENPERHRRVIVVASEGWNIGVIGIVASRLVETYYRPAIVLGIEGETGMAKGSARSIEGFDIYRALTACADLLPHYGGHPMAAGMTLPADHLPELQERLTELAEQWLTEEDYVPLMRVDAELDLKDAGPELIAQLNRLEPCGYGNPTPCFRISGAGMSRMQVVGSDRNHLKLTLTRQGHSLDAVGFRMGDLARDIAPHSRPDCLGELTLNEWAGRRVPQLVIRDVAVEHVQVFDWRSNRIPEERLRAVACRPDAAMFAASPGGSGTAGARLSWDMEEMPDLTSFRRIVFADLPPSLDRFERVVRAASRVERLYFAYGDASLDPVFFHVPDRERFKLLYAILLRKKWVHPRLDLEGLHRRTGMSKRMIAFILKVFSELGFLERDGERWSVVEKPAKRSLEESRTYRDQLERERVWNRLVYSSYRDLCAYLSAITSLDIRMGGSDKHGFQGKNSRDSRLSATGNPV